MLKKIFASVMLVAFVCASSFADQLTSIPPEEAAKVALDGASYLGVSAVFSTPTKADAPASAGLEGLRRIRRMVRIPQVGIGGISAANTQDVIRSGADGIPVVSAIVASLDPCMAARRLRSVMEK